eukprot:3507955-Amphidinium_carterae.1
MSFKELTRAANHFVGKSLVCFLHSADHVAQFKSLERGQTLVQGFRKLLGYDVLHWCPASVDESQPHLISPVAHAYILERAPTSEIVRDLTLGPLLRAMVTLVRTKDEYTNGVPEADRFIGSILDLLPDNLVLVVLHTLCTKVDGMVPLHRVPANVTFVTSKNAFLPVLGEALNTEDLAEYLHQVSEWDETDSRAHRPLRLAMEEVPELKTRYLTYFRSLPHELVASPQTLKVHET